MKDMTTNSTPSQPMQLIAAVAAKGRQYTDARNALVAHELAIGVAQSVIVREAGLDKGDVSRVAKLVKQLSPTELKKLKGLQLSGMSADDHSSLSVAIQLGEKLRRVKPATSSKSSSSKSSDEPDVLAALHSWLLTATDEQYEARVALVRDVLARMDDDRANAAAAATEDEEAAAA